MIDDIPVAQRQLSSHYPSSPSHRKLFFWSMGILVSGILVFVTWVLENGLFFSEVDVSPVTVRTDPLPSATPAIQISLLGHYPFAEAPQAALKQVGSYHGRETWLRIQAADAYLSMSAAAQKEHITLTPISGFRSQKEQESLFFKKAQAQSLRPQERAEVSAPPGYSEHHTGYAIDIGDGSRPDLDLQVSFESSPAFGWLKRHAARFGFELSFPPGNAQGVTYEPWHWRYVGDLASLETFYKNTPQGNPKPIP
jgi:D-alanyl-D-alanine carboxypeptidase